MPKRSNDFQLLIANIYDLLKPLGATLTESAMVRENGDGREREVDVLIEYSVAGHDMRIGVECRDRARRETVEWIDALIGKYNRLPINKVVAISSSGFSPEAERKAKDQGIDTLTLKEAIDVEWASYLARESFNVMTHAFLLMRLGTKNMDGTNVTYTEIDENGKITHADPISEAVYPTLHKLCFEPIRKRIGTQGMRLIGQNWRSYFDDPTPRYFEVDQCIEGAKIQLADGSEIKFDNIVFGIG